MANHKLDTRPGDTFGEVAENAKIISAATSQIVEFDFNGILCLVNEKTDLDLLWRDYLNGHTMEWKFIGPACAVEYSQEIKQELERRTKEREAKHAAQAKKQRERDSSEKSLVMQQINGIALQVVEGKESDFKDYTAKNSKDGYSRAVIDYAETWAKLMQVEIANGKAVESCAETTQSHLGYLGITGFQYGAAVHTLAHFWKYGDQLRKWHNKKYGVSEDTEGTVNPAVLTLRR